MWRCACPLLALTILSTSLPAEEPYPPPYDGLQAGQDAYSYAETRRRTDLRRQLRWLDESRVRQGIPPSYGTVIYDVPPVAGYSYDAAWASPFGYRRYSEQVGVYGPGGPVYPTYAGGSLFGRPYYNPTPQPIGQVQIQTGPDRWESHPVYPPAPLTPDTAPGISAPGPRPTPPSTDMPRPVGLPREF